MIRGLPISPGVAVARAFRLDPALARHNPSLLDAAGLSSEVSRFDKACDAVATQLDSTIERIRVQLGEESAGIFRAHRMLVRDPAFVAKVKGFILHHSLDAISSLNKALEEYDVYFAKIHDDYLRERMTDIRDVVEQLIQQLADVNTFAHISTEEAVILVAPEIRPSQAALFDRLAVSGIITEAGGSTGHAAVLARTLGIPAVSGLQGLMSKVHANDLVIVDGREGIIIINPGPEVEAAYRKLQREYVDLRHSLFENRDLKAITKDGVRIELFANVNTAADAVTATEVGADGVGLFRTEYVFLTHPSVPTEEEQTEEYRKVIEAAPNHSVVVRTLDLGGDKHVKYFAHHREANPFMGWRSIRMSSEHPEFFQTQLRAILRAAVGGQVSILFPMISTVDEVRKLKRLVDRARMALHQQKVPYGEQVSFGVMVEVPAAAICIDHIIREVDYVSIGSNDLIQYMMAADRDNPRVAHLCDPCHPAVLRVLKKIIGKCNAHAKPVTLCGEMAGKPVCLLPLLGFGLRRMSMSPSFIPTIKEMVRSIKVDTAHRVAKKALRMQTAAEVRAYLTDRLRKMCPNVVSLDTI
ncbi:phosphoenolpyruvate--protein phosphotransferase [Zavarzinella formosa]|uniref:phosphoenolpyruvate--protein phosphotransferase n=1 Tax=Zavarzinella formosa TaxID=360055 RepID=UPI00031AF4EB|nr:phosphoenolpyruvate--protein phosphotransferase [Zavarzinella formosa]